MATRNKSLKIRDASINPSMAKGLYMEQFIRTGGCAEFGAPACWNCERARCIPRDDCDPPDDCLTCPQRDRCPCGNVEFSC